MCDLFSWVKKADGTVLFLRDSDIEARWNPSDENFREYIGHHAIESYHKEEFKEHLEDIYTVPKELAEAVNRGECRRMLQSVGYKTLEYKIGKRDGKLYKVDGMTKEERIEKFNSLIDATEELNNPERIRIGSEVILGKHKIEEEITISDWASRSTNWAPDMGAFVGRKTTITCINPELDLQDCFTARVKIDKNRWSWRIRDMQVVKY